MEELREEKTKRGGVMKKCLIVLGALFCLMIAGGYGLTGCTAEVDISLTKYTITLKAAPGIIEGGGGVSTKTYKVTAGAWVLPRAIDSEGYCTFDGWENDNGYRVGIGGGSITILSDTTLYATWRGCDW